MNAMPPLSPFHRAIPMRVRGESMRPILPPGARILAAPLEMGAPLEPGDIVVARRPGRGEVDMVKRVLAVTASGAVLLAGDNAAASTESVDFGPVPRSAILARVLWRYWPLPPRRLSRPAR